MSPTSLPDALGMLIRQQADEDRLRLVPALTLAVYARERREDGTVGGQAEFGIAVLQVQRLLGVSSTTPEVVQLAAAIEAFALGKGQLVAALIVGIMRRRRGLVGCGMEEVASWTTE